MKIGGIQFLDTLTMLNASLPIGEMTIRFMLQTKPMSTILIQW